MDEVVVQAASWDERVLVRAEKVIEPGHQAQREDLREVLGEEVNQALGPVNRQGHKHPRAWGAA